MIGGSTTIGGDGSLSIAQQFHEHGIPIVGVPKTIDNDLEGALWTFGFDSAVACATDSIDRLHSTAESHNRVMVLDSGMLIFQGSGEDAVRNHDVQEAYLGKRFASELNA